MEMLNGSTYCQIGNRKVEVEAVSAVFERIANAPPTTVTPKNRADLLKSILGDLEDSDNTAWQGWSDDIRLKALQAVKVLGRNPVGSECLARPPCLPTILYHASLGPSSPPSHPHPASFKGLPFLTPIQSESVTILANTLTLHPMARRAMIKLGGGEAVLRLLRGAEGGDEGSIGKEEVDLGSAKAEAAQMSVFLLGRVLFYLTVEQSDFVVALVEKQETVDALVKIMESLAPTQSSFRALPEVLKVVYNVVLHHPCKLKSQDELDVKGDGWDDKLDPLIQPLLNHLFLLPLNDLLPPLSNVINALTLFPFTASLNPLWTAPSPLSTQRSSSPSKRRSLYNVLTTNPFLSSTTSSSSNQKKSDEFHRHKPRTGSSSSNSSAGGRGKASIDLSRTATPDIVSRLLTVLSNFLDANTPPLPATPDDPLPEKSMGIVMDDVLPPVVGLLTRMALGSEVLREGLKRELLPDSLDRSPSSSPLEARPGLLGHLLRFLRSATHPQTQQTVDFFFWAVCGSDAGVVQEEIGYGNAAGLLFRRGIAANAPPKSEAHIESLTAEEEELEILKSSKQAVNPTPVKTSFASSQKPKSSRPAPSSFRDPITSLQPAPPEPSPFAGMSDEEKEREAERLYVAFERMNKNGVIGLENPVETAMKAGKLDGWEKKQRQVEEEERKKEEEDDEREAEREIADWKKRMGRK